jgi:hypothetical protein
MAGFVSSVNLIAGAGILGNIGGVALAANTTAVTNIATYESLGVIGQFANVVSTGNAVLSSNISIALRNLASNTFPAVTNAVPSAYIGDLGNTPIGGLTGLLTTEIDNIMGNGDLGKFEQVIGSAEGLVVSTNQLINSVVNANNSSSNATYSTQDNVLTAGFSQITQAFEVFSLDIADLGLSIDFSDLPNLGSPQSLLKQIFVQTSGSAELNTALLTAGIPQNVLDNITEIPMTDEQQKLAYDVMTTITGTALTKILQLLRVTTVGLTTMADLLNPVKTFSRSFNTLTTPTSNGLRGIYINSSGGVNSNLETELPTSVLTPIQGYQNVRNTYSQLRRIIPPDQALANKALQAGLQQVKSIFNSTMSLTSAATLGLESNKGLNLINSLAEPLPTEVSDFYKQTYASGTGNNGTLLLTDVIGTAAGWQVNDNLSNTITILTSLTNSGDLNTLTSGTNGVFTVMQNAINGVYGVPDGMGNVMTIPGGLPAAGTYNTYDDAFAGPGSPGVGLIPAAYSLIGNIVANNSSATSNTNSSWSGIAEQLSLEATNTAYAGIVFSELQPGIVPNSLVTNLPQYGLDTSVGGTAWYFESIANTSSLGGQAVISVMREARNQVRLQEAGIETDIIVSDTVAQPQATLSSGQYTVAEATSQKII